jgi:DNA-binding transcriptional LysR family regulator
VSEPRGTSSPEVMALTREMRQLVGRAYSLSQQIDEAVDDLSDFTRKSDTRMETRRVHPDALDELGGPAR